jgi:hypothetical protein
VKARITLLTLAMATCLAVPLAANAHRPASSAEAKAVRTAVAAYVKNPASHAAPDNKVVKATISTVDPHFAAASLKSVSGNSTALLKRAGKGWKVIGFSPSQSCSLASKSVRKDLSIICGKS